MLEAFILASTYPQYDKRLFIDLPQFNTLKLQAQNMLCTWLVLNVKTKNKKQFMYTTCSELVSFMYWTDKSINNLLSYCGLVVARISTSEKDLPVRELLTASVLIFVVSMWHHKSYYLVGECDILLWMKSGWIKYFGQNLFSRIVYKFICWQYFKV